MVAFSRPLLGERTNLEPLAALRPLPPLPRRSTKRRGDSTNRSDGLSSEHAFPLDMWRIDAVEWTHSATRLHPLVEEERRSWGFTHLPTKGGRLDVRA